MRNSKIDRDTETWKLEIRYLVQTGSWEKAWTQVNDAYQRTVPSNHERPIPLSVWLEFFALPRIRNLAKLSPQKDYGSDGEKGHGDQDASHQPQRLASPYKPPSSLWAHRLKLLFDKAPTETIEYRRASPSRIRKIVEFLLRLQHIDAALKISKDYLSSLPRSLSSTTAKTCTDIINLHVAFGSPHSGLRKLKHIERQYKQLLELHGDLRPDSNTLFLMLSPLRRVKRCGSAAKSIVEDFVKEWGPEIVDARVRRRVTSLALKEGRIDIAQEYSRPAANVLPTQPAPGSASKSWQLSRSVVRAPRRVLFSKAGKENYLWHQLRRRVSLRLRDNSKKFS